MLLTIKGKNKLRIKQKRFYFNLNLQTSLKLKVRFHVAPMTGFIFLLNTVQKRKTERDSPLYTIPHLPVLKKKHIYMILLDDSP